MTDMSSATTLPDSGVARNLDLPVVGLSETEARARLQRGEGNDAGIRPSRTYWDIARANLFTLFNNILFVIGVALIAVGRYNDALTSVGLGLVNALISTYQEIRAKCQLDRITLVSTPRTTVMRDGRPLHALGMV